MATSRPFTVSPAMTAIVIGYSNPDVSLIADQVMPRVPVPTETFKYLSYDVMEAFTVPDTKVGRRGRVPQVEFGATEQAGFVNDHGLSDVVPVSDIEAATAMRARGLSTYDPINHATQRLAGLVKLAREIRVASIVMNSANYAVSRIVALSGTDKFSDYANSNPIAVIKAAINSTLVFRANTVVMGNAEWNVINSHPKIVNAVKGNVTGQGIISKEDFCRLFDVKNLLVGDGWVNTARRGQSGTLARAWSGGIACLYLDRAVDTQGGATWGFSPQFGGPVAGTFQDADVGLKGGQEIRVGEQINEMVVAKDVGALITGII